MLRWGPQPYMRVLDPIGQTESPESGFGKWGSLMRWYVSRNGETVGPVEEADVANWVRAGMHDAMLRDEAGGPWTPVSQSPFGALLPRVRPTPSWMWAGIGIAVIGAGFLLVVDPPKFGSTLQPAAAQPAAAAPNPTPTNQAVTVSPGLGVTRGAIEDKYEQLGYQFEPSTAVHALKRTQGKSEDELGYVELIGPDEDLVSATMMTAVAKEGVTHFVAFLVIFLPDWKDGPKWVGNAVSSKQGHTVKQVGKRWVEVNNASAMHFATLTVSAREPKDAP